MESKEPPIQFGWKSFLKSIQDGLEGLFPPFSYIHSINENIVSSGKQKNRRS